MSWCPRRRSILASFSLTGILLAIILIHKHTVPNSSELPGNFVSEPEIYLGNNDAPQSEELVRRNDQGIVLLREYTIINNVDENNALNKPIGEDAIANDAKENKQEERESGWNGRTLNEEKNSREEDSLPNDGTATERENKVENIISNNTDLEQKDLPKSIKSNMNNLEGNQSSFKEENDEKLNEKPKSEEQPVLSYAKEIETEKSFFKDVKKNYSENVEVQARPEAPERKIDLIQNSEKDGKTKNEVKTTDFLKANDSGLGLEIVKKQTTQEMAKSPLSDNSSSSSNSRSSNNSRNSSSSNIRSSSSDTSRNNSIASKKNKDLYIRPLNLTLSNHTIEKSNIHRNQSISKTRKKLTKTPSYKKVFKQFIYWNKMFVIRAFTNESKDIDFHPGHRVPINKVRRVLIVSTWRSGSTFLGDIFNSYPAAFYSFEPLHMKYRNKHLQKGEDIAEALNFMKDIFTCNISYHQEYMKYLREYKYVLIHNKFMWNSCYGNRAYCFDPKFMSQICQLAPLNVMKTVRLGLLPVETLMKDETLDLKVIHLVRDPRGSLHSRLKLSWCQSNICRDPKTVCDSLYTDLKLSDSYLKKYPEKFLIIRYEDLSLNPMSVSEKILNFVGLGFHNSTRNFLKEHTQLENSSGGGKHRKIGTYTTFRDSQSTPFHWRDSFSFKGVGIIQKACKNTLSALGYRVFDSQAEYQNKNISILINS